MNDTPSSPVTVVVKVATPRLLVRFRAEDPNLFNSFKSLYRARFGVLTRWSRADNAWVLPVRERAPLAAWLSLYVAADDIAWVDDVGGWGRTTSYTSAASPLDQAYRTLFLLPSAPPEVVAAVHRALVKLHHPDVADVADGAHSAHSAMVTINQAITAIRGATR